MLVDLKDLFEVKQSALARANQTAKAGAKSIEQLLKQLKRIHPPKAKAHTKVRARGKSGGIPPKKIKIDPYTGYAFDDETIERSKVGRPPKKRGPLNTSTFYQHVVRAIYNTGLTTGYPFRGTPEKSSQAIARAKMIQWGYARRKQNKGGIPDRRSITLTPKGVVRNRKHQKEPGGTKAAKARSYQYIYNRDPL